MKLRQLSTFCFVGKSSSFQTRMSIATTLFSSTCSMCSRGTPSLTEHTQPPKRRLPSLQRCSARFSLETTTKPSTSLVFWSEFLPNSYMHTYVVDLCWRGHQDAYCVLCTVLGAMPHTYAGRWSYCKRR